MVALEGSRISGEGEAMIRYVKKEDIGQVLSMMEEVKEYFPGYQEAEFLEALQEAIQNRETFLDEERGKLAGMVSFSYTEKEITFLAVRPEFQKCGIGRKLIEQVKSCFDIGEMLSVITFGAGDEKGKAARHCYYSCGFEDGEELIVFDYPCQKMKVTIL